METIDDIVADIRAQNQGLPEDGYALSPLVSDLLGIADRLEAAAEAEQGYYKDGFRSLMILTEGYKNELDMLGLVYRTAEAFSNGIVTRKVLHEN